jgi:hypothetical protein
MSINNPLLEAEINIPKKLEMFYESTVDSDLYNNAETKNDSQVKSLVNLSQHNKDQCFLTQDKSKLPVIDKLIESFINNNLQLDKYYYLKTSSNCIFNKYYNECHIY